MENLLHEEGFMNNCHMNAQKTGQKLGSKQTEGEFSLTVKAGKK
jgi:hypothetical protein